MRRFPLTNWFRRSKTPSILDDLFGRRGQASEEAILTEHDEIRVKNRDVATLEGIDEEEFLSKSLKQAMESVRKGRTVERIEAFKDHKTDETVWRIYYEPSNELTSESPHRNQEEGRNPRTQGTNQSRQLTGPGPEGDNSGDSDV